MTASASWLETIWTASMLVAFVATIVSMLILVRKYRSYRSPDKDGVRSNGAAIWIFRRDIALHVGLALMTAVFTLVGVAAMLTPEPVRPQNKSEQNLVAMVFIAVAVGTAAYTLLYLWMGRKIDQGLAAEQRKAAKAAKKAERRTPPGGIETQ